MKIENSKIIIVFSLRSRQRLWEKQEQERIRSIPDPTVPEGHTVMADKERRETLSTLKQSMYYNCPCPTS